MPSYDFKNLSDKDFEILSRDLLQVEHNIYLQSFKAGTDGGIDLLQDVKGLIVQCKHFANSGYSKLLSALKKESHNVSKLKPEKYIITTSVGLTPLNKNEIKKLFEPYIQTSDDIYGRDDLNNLLSAHPDVEKRHFKLWLASTNILGHIFNAKIINQTRFDFEKIIEKSRVYVQTNAFQDALKALEGYNCCLISGQPGVGKTTLAEMLILYYLKLNYEFVRVFKMDDAFQYFDNTKSQVFYFDDVLGQTFLKRLEEREDEKLILFIEEVRKEANTKFILTTREYILNKAKEQSEKLSWLRTNGIKYTLEIKDYSTYEKALILYNHIYFSDLPRECIDSLLQDRSYFKIIEHENYNPRIIELITKNRELFSETGDFITDFISNLDNPSEIWRFAFEKHISNYSRYFLITLLSLPEKVLLPRLEKAFWATYYQASKKFNFETSPNGFILALQELDNSFISVTGESDDRFINFINPSVKDFLDNYIDEKQQDLLVIAESANELSQMLWLWGDESYSGVERRRSTLNNLKELYSNRLLKHCLKLKHHTYYHSLNTGDSSYEANLLRVFEILTNLSRISENSSDIKRCIKKLILRLDNGLSNITDLMRLMSFMKKKPIKTLYREGELYPNIFQFVLNKLPTEGFCYWDEDEIESPVLENILLFIQSFPECFSKQDISKIGEKFILFLKKTVENLDPDYFWPDTLDNFVEISDKLSEVLKTSYRTDTILQPLKAKLGLNIRIEEAKDSELYFDNYYEEDDLHYDDIDTMPDDTISSHSLDIDELFDKLR